MEAYVLLWHFVFFLKQTFSSWSLRCASAISVSVRGYILSSSFESMSSSHQFFETVIQHCFWQLLFLTIVVWKLSAVWLTLGSYSSHETAPTTVLCMPFIWTISSPYSSSNNLHCYTWSVVKPRASLMRFVWSVNTFMFWPHSIPLNSFKVSTIASSSILVTLYLRCASGEFPTE